MWIMNVVWPVTALFGTVFLTWFYFRYGRAPPAGGAHVHRDHGGNEKSFPVAVAIGTTHCGAGCTLG